MTPLPPSTPPPAPTYSEQPTVFLACAVFVGLLIGVIAILVATAWLFK